MRGDQSRPSRPVPRPNARTETREEGKAMTKKTVGTIGTGVPITDADIDAFRVNHALDSRLETDRYNVAPGSYVVQERVVFEIFRFEAEETGVIIFDIRGIKDALADGKLLFQMFDTPLVEHWIEHIRDKGGVEVERMQSLTAADLERPPVAVFWPNGYTTVIDGNNRLVRRWDDGLRNVRMAVIPLGREVYPYMCREGEEEKFLQRRSKEDPREMMHLGSTRVGIVGLDIDEHGKKIAK
jgi:hypothetical protein